MLTIIGPVQSRTFRVLWALEELGLPYEHQSERPWSEAVRELNPLGQVPILRDGDTVLTDSLAIMHYLADREGKLTFPAGTPERAHLDARINFLLTEMEAPLWLASRHSYVLPEDKRHPEVIPVARADFALAEEKFVRLLGRQPFIAGDVFTIADIVAGHIAGWAVGAKFGHQTRALADYFARMKARPAWSKARNE
jgi:glutathione S-transferase